MGMSFALGALCVAIASLKSLVSGSTNSFISFNDPIINFILFVTTGAFGLFFVFVSCVMLLELDMSKVSIFDADNRLITIRKKTIFGKRTQDIPFDKIIDIESTPSLDDDGKIWSYELVLVVGDKETIGLDTYSAGDEKIVKRQQENAKRIRLFLGN